jgi:hypothetical protein
MAYRARISPPPRRLTGSLILHAAPQRDLRRSAVEILDGANLATRSESDKPPAPYNPAAVVSDEFGEATDPMRRQIDFSDNQTSVLAVIEAVFAVSSGVGGAPSDAGNNGRGPDPTAAEENLFFKSKPPREAKINERLRRALKGVEVALLEPDFIAARRPGLLRADIALAAILLVKGLADGYLEVEPYRETTRRLWSELFFGFGGNGTGSIPQRLQEVEADERAEFIAAFASPKLSAALTLWSLTEWRVGDPEAPWFRMSAVQLQHQHPWLFASAPPDSVVIELQSQATSLLPPNEQRVVNAAWIEMIRSGEALRLLSETLTSVPHDELTAKVTAKEVGAHELLWQANALAFPVQAYRRESSVRAGVRFLGKASVRKFRGNYLVPVQNLLTNELFNLPTLAKKELGRFIEAATTVRRFAGEGPRAGPVRR